MSTELDELFAARFGRWAGAAEQAVDSVSMREIAAHRSCRRFAQRSVDDSLLDTALAGAFSAPAKSDLQQACVIQITQSDLRAQIDAMFPRAPWVASAPVLLVWCGDNRRIRRICEMRGKEFANDHLDSFFNAAVDSALVMMSFIRAAEALGLGCCPLSELRNHSARVAELLHLPPYVFATAGMAVGWPADEGELSARLPQSVTVHRDRYDDSDLSAQVDFYDERRRAMQPDSQKKQRLADRYGRIDNYGWSEDKARQVSESAREDFGAFIRGQGFKLD